MKIFQSYKTESDNLNLSIYILNCDLKNESDNMLNVNFKFKYI